MLSTPASAADLPSLRASIASQAEAVRSLKESGASKEALAPAVKELLELKGRLPEGDPDRPKPKQQKKKQPPPSPAAASPADASSDSIVPRSQDFSQWYQDVIKASELAESSPTRGSMIIKPWGMKVWDLLKKDLDGRITEKHGVDNAYFPLLIPKSFLSKEAEHVDGFAKECAVVTHHRLKADPADPANLIPDPDAELEEPLIVRPTSETIIWSSFRSWINSHRDLPLKINQWANVLRWELRTRPFLRTSEFLWQEGHTAHATGEGALEDARKMIGEYSQFTAETLALPTVVGVKSPSERFAGAEETYTIEALMQNGWALQSGTSHYLGQSFGKAFDVTYQTSDESVRETVYGTSWGVSTRLVGALIMTHSDDAGLVLPPPVAPQQVVIVPIPGKKEEEKAAVGKAVDKLAGELRGKGLRVKVDDRDWIRNGAKYYEWERKGVPLRIEVGPRDVAKSQCVLKWRKMKEDKEAVGLDDVAAIVDKGMGEYHDFLLQSARDRLAGGIRLDASYEDMKGLLEKDEAGAFDGAGLFLVPWKCDAANEDKIKEECKATIRCYPLDVNEMGMAEGKTCFYSGEPATHMALFGRAF
ncbi:hypothetical protein TeGR_g9232 [Tetraparma gracilis]|uniref:proline--tRNA ligase n=1 Tax=Tetraparma gracilis TaxID=2962635 RepID=A0ABQ6MHC0_9STRA|nr:hypothetical protein TeGR_g9232 [Tetraparma gracilis]